MDDEFEPIECDCLDAEIDILTGRETCHICGRSRYLTSEEFKNRLKLQAEWEDAYYEEIAVSEKLSNYPPPITR